MTTKRLFYELRDQVSDKFSYHQLEREAHQHFFVKSCKFKKFSFQDAEVSYEKLYKKYEENSIEVWPNQWHKHQRKLFIEILIWYCKIYKTIPSKMREQEWQYLSDLYFDKNPMFLKFQGLNMLKISQKFIWEPQDDQRLIRAVEEFGEGNWNQISKNIFFQSKCARFIAPKQCRQRWFNHLSSKISRQTWKDSQDLLILKHVFEKNRRWCEIVKVLNHTRTEHMVKNRFMRLVRNKFKENSKKELQFISFLIRKIENKIKEPHITEISRDQNRYQSKMKKNELMKSRRLGKFKRRLQKQEREIENVPEEENRHSQINGQNQILAVQNQDAQENVQQPQQNLVRHNTYNFVPSNSIMYPWIPCQTAPNPMNFQIFVNYSIIPQQPLVSQYAFCPSVNYSVIFCQRNSQPNIF